MLSLELIAFAIAAVYVLFRAVGDQEPGHYLARLAIISAASWAAEESSILLYNFYSYSPAWTLFLGHVPLMVVLVWPAVIHSAWDLASEVLRPGSRLVPLVAAAIVLTDASLIEPLAVNTGFWAWRHPGLFHVPLVGILGWAYFSFLCVFLFEQAGRQEYERGRGLLVLLLSVPGVHLLLLGTWWGGLRWTNMPVNPAIAAGVAWAASLVLVYSILRNRTGKRVKKKTLLLRLPGALFFFSMLALKARGLEALVVYSVAFAPPYLTLMAQQYAGRPSNRSNPNI